MTGPAVDEVDEAQVGFFARQQCKIPCQATEHRSGFDHLTLMSGRMNLSDSPSRDRGWIVHHIIGFMKMLLLTTTQFEWLRPRAM